MRRKGTEDSRNDEFGKGNAWKSYDGCCNGDEGKRGADEMRGKGGDDIDCKKAVSRCEANHTGS